LKNISIDIKTVATGLYFIVVEGDEFQSEEKILIFK